MRKKRTAYLLLLPLMGVTALAMLACGSVLTQSLGVVPAFGLTEPTLDYYREALTDPAFFSALGVSLRTALLSALAAAALGTALCGALVRLGRDRGPMAYLIRLPILTPHAVTALFAILLLSQTGLLARWAWALGLLSEPGAFPQLLFTPGYGGTILAYLWKEIPFVAYFTLALMAGVSRTLGEALPVYAHLAYMHPDLRQRPAAMALYGLILLLSAALAALYGLLTRRLLRRVGGGQ